MLGLMIVAHAPLSSALREVAAHVFPERAGLLAVVDVPAEWSAEAVEAEIRRQWAQRQETQWLVLTDVFGATPCNVAQRLADGSSVRVVCGVNVSMLWRVLCFDHESLELAVSRAVAGGAQGVMSLGAARPQNQASEIQHAHDSHHAHHQQ